MRKNGWHFPKSAGFTGSAGLTPVKGHMRSKPKMAKGGIINNPMAKELKTKTPAQMIPGRQTPFRRQDLMRKVGFNKKPLIGG